jgi:hypothetical protein
MSRLWESADRAIPPYKSALQPHVLDIRDDPQVFLGVSVRAADDGIVLTLPIDAETDVEVTLTREAARRISAALGDAARE